MPIDERIAQSDLVIVAEITKIEDGLGAVKVARVLKGPADVKEVTVTGVRERARPGPGPIQAVQQGGAAAYTIGEKLIWTLRKVRDKAIYENICTYWKEQADRADEVAGIVAAQANPAPRLRQLDEVVAPRMRLAAAYAVLRVAVTENRLPHGAAGSSAGPLSPLPLTKDYELLDSALVNRAVEAVLAYFPPEASKKLGPGEHTLVFDSLQKLGCPLSSLYPQDKDDALKEETEQTAKQRWDRYAEAVRKWWADNKDKLKLYLPKAEAVKLGLIKPQPPPVPPPSPAPEKK